MKRYALIFYALTIFFLLAACGESTSTQTPTSSPSETVTGGDEEQTASTLEITEIMPSNKATIMDSFGNFSDWIEIQNTGSIPAVLSDFYITDDIENMQKAKLPEITLDPGEYAILFASDTECVNGDEIHLPFKLSKEGETVFITRNDGILVSTLSYENMQSDMSVCNDGKVTQFATPMFSNDDAGYAAFRAGEYANGLIISEVMTANSEYLITSGGETYDWVELYNNSSQTVKKGEYALSDDSENPTKFVIDAEIPPNGYYTVYCSDDRDAKVPVSGFSLGSNDALYLSKDGSICDFVALSRIPYPCSYARSDDGTGFAFSSTPTPNAGNGKGILMIARTPEVSVPQGVYDHKPLPEVELSGEGKVFYTLDGSCPTEASAQYTEPISVTKTTVIRAISVCEGKLNSSALTASYIVNEGHTLPVLSLAANPEDLFDPETGIYVKGNHDNYYMDWEKAAHISLLCEGGSVFSEDCGLCMFGSGSRETCEKKSLRVNFKSKYGVSKLDCDVFSDGITDYKSLVLRAGEDAPFSVFRSEVFTTLAKDTNLLTQNNKFCILYVNGEYFGIFCLCERFSEDYYAEHFNVDAAGVTVEDAPVSVSSHMGKLIEYSLSHDMREDEHYKYVEKRLDLDCLTDWFVFQAYTHNRDAAGNLRYIHDESSDRIKLAFYDLDWAFYHRENRFKIINDDEQYGIILRELLKNDGFRARFISRTGKVLNTVLTDDAVLRQINTFYDLIKPEIQRERKRWTHDGAATVESWEDSVQRMRDYVTSSSIKEEMIESLRAEINLTEAEAAVIRG